jgi:signal transduction histidine kinase
LGVKVVPQDVDLASAVDEELRLLRAAHPHRSIEFVASGDNRGRWDGGRVQQILRNLVSNAIAYGTAGMPVQVRLRGTARDVWIEVTNDGPMDPSEVRGIFDPLSRGLPQQRGHDAPQGLGLGLFIVREIARAHDGEVEARCDAQRTTFAVRLPRAHPAASASAASNVPAA